MRIEITDKYCLSSDPHNFIIERHYKSGKGKNKGKLRNVPVGFFPTLSQALRRLVQLDLMNSDLYTISKLQQQLSSLEEKINRLDDDGEIRKLKDK